MLYDVNILIAMKVCQACGNTMNDDDEFCSKCGAYFEKPKQSSTSQQTSGSASDVVDIRSTAAKWVAEIKDGLVIDETKYNEILTDCVSSVYISIASDASHQRGGVADLAIMIDDYDLVTDLLSGIADRMEHIGFQRQLMNVSNEYIFIVIDAFAVYTDLQDLREICTEATSVFNRMADMIDSLEPMEKADRQPKPYLENYAQYFELVGSKIDAMISSMTPERMEFLSDYWAEHSESRFPQSILAGANANAQLINMGKIGGKLASKARDIELNAFATLYMAPKQ